MKCLISYSKIDVTQYYIGCHLLRNNQGIFRPLSHTVWQVLCVKMCEIFEQVLKAPVILYFITFTLG